MRIVLSFIIGWASASLLASSEIGDKFWTIDFLRATIVALIVLSVVARLGALALMRVLRRFEDYAAANRTRRTRVLLPVLVWGGRLLAVLGAPRAPMMSVRSALANYWHSQANWPQTLDSAGRLARQAASPLGKLLATNTMLEALAMLDRREAFALTFVSAEGLAQKAAEATRPAAEEGSKAEAKKAEAEAARPLQMANYWRGVLAFRAADFVDARHWLGRARRLDPSAARSCLLLAEIAALEGDETKALAALRDARGALEGTRTANEAFRDKLLGTLAGGADAPDAEARTGSAIETLLREKLGGMAEQALDNSRWQAAWAEIKVGFWLGEAGRIDRVLGESAAIGEASTTGRFQVRLAESLSAALRREGYDCEKPYFQAREIARWETIDPHARGEMPLLRALSQFHRGMPEAALRKLDELMELPAWLHPPLTEAIADAYRAACCRELGRKSSGVPFIDSARARLAKGTRLRALEQFAKRMAA